MKRKGLGLGKGMGYKNIVPLDPHIHSLSARGIKSKQLYACKKKLKAKGIKCEHCGHRFEPEFSQEPIKGRYVCPNCDELNAKGRERYKEFIDDWDIEKEDLIEIENKYGSRVEEIDEWYNEEDFIHVKLEDGTEFIVAPSEDKAEKLATEQVRDDLENDPELFSQSWLQNFITMTDTDRRMIADEETNDYVDNLDNEELIEEADMQDDYDEIQTDIDKEYDKKTAPNKKKVEKLEQKQEDLIEAAKDTLRDSKYDEIYDALEDPVEYFVEDRGIYSIEDLMKQSFVSIDYEEASEDAIDTDGWAHFLSRYDGDYDELKSGKVIWRDT